MLKQNTAILQGAGFRLRPCHAAQTLRDKPNTPWLEIMPENQLANGDATLQTLDQVRRLYPMSFHSISFTIVGTDPLNTEHIKKIKLLGDRIQASCISGNLSFCTGEWKFINKVSYEADCHILLDVKNVYVNAYDHEFSATEYTNKIEKKRVKQFHLGDYLDKKTHLLDSHSTRIPEEAWTPYQHSVNTLSCQPTLIEWDSDISSLNVLLQEAQRAQSILAEQHYETKCPTDVTA